MTQANYHLAVTTFHSAIDCELSNNNEEAYKKYAEGLSLVSSILKNEFDLLNQSNIVSTHRHLLEYAKRSVDRLDHILEKLEHGPGENGDSSMYRRLSSNLPEIVTKSPIIPMNFPDEAAGCLSPLSSLQLNKENITKNYQNVINSLMDTQAKWNLRLELERRLAESEALTMKRFEQWEKRRKSLTEQCQKIAEQKFFIQEKIKSGIVNDSDFTKQNLYAVCLQYHKENHWTQEATVKIQDSVGDVTYVKKVISFVLQHKSHPLACMLRQLQQKILNRLARLHTNQISLCRNENIILEEHLKNIIRDIKEDLFILTTVIQALWEHLASEKNQMMILDTLHNLYFPVLKPHLIKLIRVTLLDQEVKLKKYSEEFNKRNTRNFSHLHQVISKLHQLPFMYNPTSMMSFLVEILRVCMNDNGIPGSTTLASGIDEMMPKLIELVLVSNLSILPAEITFVENFMPAMKALGEEGYAVTLMQSILSYIYASDSSECY